MQAPNRIEMSRPASPRLNRAKAKHRAGRDRTLKTVVERWRACLRGYGRQSRGFGSAWAGTASEERARESGQDLLAVHSLAYHAWTTTVLLHSWDPALEPPNGIEMSCPAGLRLVSR
jgi:hypothetical protein